MRGRAGELPCADSLPKGLGDRLKQESRRCCRGQHPGHVLLLSHAINRSWVRVGQLGPESVPVWGRGQLSMPCHTVGSFLLFFKEIFHEQWIFKKDLLLLYLKGREKGRDIVQPPLPKWPQQLALGQTAARPRDLPRGCRDPALEPCAAAFPGH